MQLPHIVWLDNYAHFLKVNAPKMSTQMWRECQWAVCGIISQHSLANQEFLRRREGVHVMPSRDDVLEKNNNEATLSYFKAREDQPSECFETSVSRNVNRVPIKRAGPASTQADEDRFFIPKGIYGNNIGSNQGLLKLLMATRRDEEGLPNYPVLLVDVNIYWRIMKVI